MPYYSYCIEVWGNTYMSNTKPLALQKKAIWITYYGEIPP